jgi:signal transduction histidine kinase
MRSTAPSLRRGRVRILPWLPSALNINLTIARDRLPPKSAAQVGARLAEALNIVDETVDSIRDVIAELRPAVLDDYGLVAALRWYAKHFARRTELAVLLDIEQPRPAPRLPTDLETARQTDGHCGTNRYAFEP